MKKPADLMARSRKLLVRYGAIEKPENAEYLMVGCFAIVVMAAVTMALTPGLFNRAEYLKTLKGYQHEVPPASLYGTYIN